MTKFHCSHTDRIIVVLHISTGLVCVIKFSSLCCVTMVTGLLHMQLLKGTRIGLLLGFAVLLMTFWKTVIYWLLYAPLTTTSNPFSHLSWLQLIFLFVIPNGMWLVVPFMATLYLGAALLKSSPTVKPKGDKQN